MLEGEPTCPRICPLNSEMAVGGKGGGFWRAAPHPPESVLNFEMAGGGTVGGFCWANPPVPNGGREIARRVLARARLLIGDARKWWNDGNDGDHGRQHPSRGQGDGKPLSLQRELIFLVR